MNDKILREHLVTLLKGEQAHVSTENALNNINPKVLSTKPSKSTHSVWELLEHIRIAQHDILKYMIDPLWKSPKWPDEYWPSPNDDPSDEMFEKSIKDFFADLNDTIRISKDEKIDLTSGIPHAKQHTYLREIILDKLLQPEKCSATGNNFFPFIILPVSQNISS